MKDVLTILLAALAWVGVAVLWPAEAAPGAGDAFSGPAGATTSSQPQSPAS